jgi:hypothetical protein
MAYFQTKISNLGKFWNGLAMEDVGLFMAIWSIYGHFVYLVDI